jgi:NADPH2:quinone reductase
MTRQARIHRDSNVLVTAAAGGVGTAAIQVAAFCGATVTAAAGSEEKRELAGKLGAHRLVTYDEIGDLGDIDVAFDPVGGAVFSACIKSLRPLGVAIGIGFAGGAWEPVDPARLVGRNVGVQGFYLGRLMGFEPELIRRETNELLALWRRGALRPVVGAEFPLEQANEALDLIGSRKSTGKVVLVP